MDDEVKIPEFSNEKDNFENETEKQMAESESDSILEQNKAEVNSFDILKTAQAMGRTLGNTGKKVADRITKEIQNYRQKQEQIRLEQERLLREQQEEEKRKRKSEEERLANIRRAQEKLRIEEEKRKAEERERIRLAREKQEREELKKKAVLAAYGADALSAGYVRDYLYSLLSEFSDDSFQASVLPDQLTISLDNTEQGMEDKNVCNLKLIELMEEHLKYTRAIFKQNNLIIALLDQVTGKTMLEQRENIAVAINGIKSDVSDISKDISSIKTMVNNLNSDPSFDDRDILSQLYDIERAINDLGQSY